MASRYWTSRIAYWMMVSFAPVLQLSKSAQSFSQSLSAIHTPIAANRERYLAALLRSIVPPRERAQSLTTGQTAGCPPTEGSSLETAPRLQNNTAPASDRAVAYSKAYFSALSGAKDFGWWKQKSVDSKHLSPLRQHQERNFNLTSTSPALHFGCKKLFPSAWRLSHFSAVIGSLTWKATNTACKRPSYLCIHLNLNGSCPWSKTHALNKKFKCKFKHL